MSLTVQNQVKQKREQKRKETEKTSKLTHIH